MTYTIVLEKGESSYGAFVPDLPGCVAAGKTRQETVQLIKEAIEFHIDGLKADKQEIPPPQCNVAQVEVNVA
jgi:predicted RNase H-like HicB family nuclease